MREFKEGDLLHAADLNAITAAVESAQQQVNEATKQTYTDELESELREAISTKTTAAQVQDLIAEIPPTDLSGIATEDYVDAQILQAQLSGSDEPIDLTPFALNSDLANKVDVVQGKGLSTADFTNAEKEKLSGIEAGAQKNPNMLQYVTQTQLQEALGSYATKVELNAVDAKIVRHYDLNGNIIEVTKEVTAQVTTYEAGKWTCDYSKVGFTEPPKPIGVVAKNTSTDLADRLVGSLGSAAITTTGASGTLMGATAVGLIGSGLVEKNGTLFVTFKGK